MNMSAIQLSQGKAETSTHSLVLEDLKSSENVVHKYVEALINLEIKLEEFRISACFQWSDFSGLKNMIQTECLLSVAEKCDLAADHQDTKTKLPKIWYLLNFLTSTEYIKTFPFFQRLSSNDQYVLARYVILPCFNLHNSYFSISKKYDTCLQPDGAKEPTEEDRHYSYDVKAVGPLIRCQIKLIEYILLKAICICNPTVPDLSFSAQVILTNERLRIVNVLFDHCLRNTQNGPSRFAELLGIFSVLESQQNMQRDSYTLSIAPFISPTFRKTIGFVDEILSLGTLY